MVSLRKTNLQNGTNSTTTRIMAREPLVVLKVSAFLGSLHQGDTVINGFSGRADVEETWTNGDGSSTLDIISDLMTSPDCVMELELIPQIT